MSRLRIGSLLLVVAASCGAAEDAAKSQTQYDAGDPTADEQYVLQVVNRGRADPAAEGKRVGIDLSESLSRQEKSRLEPRPPLAMNATLLKLAREHSKDMYDRSYFDHTTPDNKHMPERFKDGGYDYGAIAENLAAGLRHTIAQLHDLLVVDTDTGDRGHRKNLFGLDKETMTLREIGVGIFSAEKKNKDDVDTLLTEEFGEPRRSRPLLTGVVFDDANKNGFYDTGEGLAGVTVRPDHGQFYAVTSTSGGFALPLFYGRITLTISGGKLETPVTETVIVTGDNIELDVIDGKPVVNFGLTGK